MNDMTAYETIKAAREKQWSDMFQHVSKMLQPLCSPYDLSESNRIALFHNNPVFNKLVNDISYQLIELQDLKNNK